MSETGDIFREMRDHSQKKRHNNKKSSLKILSQKGIGFQEMNFGYHLRVEEVIDFYPTTGLWMTLDKSDRGRGVMDMIKFMRKKKIIV